jgi:hypothetical protein
MLALLLFMQTSKVLRQSSTPTVTVARISLLASRARKIYYSAKRTPANSSRRFRVAL